MDWLLNSPQVQSKFAQLGSMENDTFIIGDDALAILRDIYCKLSFEDQILRTFRRSIGFGQMVKHNLIPLLIHCKDEEITDMTIRLLVNITLPVECLYKIEIMKLTEVGRHSISDCHSLLSDCKRAFSDSRALKAIVDHLKNILERDSKLSLALCDSVNNCLLLLRNILHIPENAGSNRNQIQNQIVWILFSLSIDKLLIYLMTCSQRTFFGISMVQLIALIYKDQHVSSLQKLLNIWFESSTMSDSSEDYESNTTLVKEGSDDSSPILTSDSSDNGGSRKTINVERRSSSKHLDTTGSGLPINTNSGDVQNHVSSVQDKDPITPSSSLKYNHENGQYKTALPCPNTQNTKPITQSSQTDLSDCGYVTQVENPESFSTSSNEDDNSPRPHQKPPSNQKQRFNAANNPRNSGTAQEKKDQRRKKLIKRNKSSLINMKGLMHHIPSEDDISNLLKEFTVDFLLKGYGYLVKEVHAQLLLQPECAIQIDTSHFFWLITYFLKFAAHLELDLDNVKSILCYEIISYLTYEGVMLSEELDLSVKEEGVDIKPYLRRIHLAITAIKEFLQVLDSYKKMTCLTKEDKDHIHLLILQIGTTTDLQCLFVLLLRRYDPTLQSTQYLQDLIVTNHLLLLHLDEASKYTDFKGNTNIVEHIKQFATIEIMNQYGILLADFKKNGEFVNDCIFTMMHHIGGDIDQVTALLQPLILKTFFQIFETEYELCDDWSDLIEYVMHKFIKTNQYSTSNSQMASIETNNDALVKKNNEDSICDTNWSNEERETLYWYYIQSKNTKDLVGNILNLFNESHFKLKSRIAIIQQLLCEDIISTVKYDDLMKFEDIKFEQNIECSSAFSSTIESGIEVDRDKYSEKDFDDIQILKQKILTEKNGHLLLWLQKALINCCFAKLTLRNHNSINNRSFFTEQNVMEPVSYHCVLKHQSVPIVSWNNEQSIVLLNQPFMLLLHKLGFHLPADNGKIFIRIPEFWTADVLYNNAEKLGPVDRSFLKFDLSELSGLHHGTIDTTTIRRNELFAIHGMNKNNSMIRFIPDVSSYCLPPRNWLEIVANSKSTPKTIDRPPAIPDANTIKTITMVSTSSNSVKTVAASSLITFIKSTNTHTTTTSTNVFLYSVNDKN